MGACLSYTRYEEIKQAVVDTFVQYNVSCVPVNGFELATKMGVKVIPYSAKPKKHQCLLLKESDDGFSLQRDDGEWYIFYNDKKGCGRINNTIMHEIGHIVLDHSEDSELAEKEVKFFAKYALVPPVLVQKLRLDNSRDIAKTFGVSLEAARYAYDYYIKWLQHGSSEYTKYEFELLNQFRGVS